jgi:hypothetical protein
MNSGGNERKEPSQGEKIGFDRVCDHGRNIWISQDTDARRVDALVIEMPFDPIQTTFVARHQLVNCVVREIDILSFLRFG